MHYNDNVTNLTAIGNGWITTRDVLNGRYL